MNYLELTNLYGVPLSNLPKPGIKLGDVIGVIFIVGFVSLSLCAVIGIASAQNTE